MSTKRISPYLGVINVIKREYRHEILTISVWTAPPLWKMHIKPRHDTEYMAVYGSIYMVVYIWQHGAQLMVGLLSLKIGNKTFNLPMKWKFTRILLVYRYVVNAGNGLCWCKTTLNENALNTLSLVTNFFLVWSVGYEVIHLFESIRWFSSKCDLRTEKRQVDWVRLGCDWWQRFAIAGRGSLLNKSIS